MSVDQELERAVAETDAEATVPAVVPEPGPERPAPKKKGNLGLLIGLLVMVAGVLVLVFTSFKGAAIYSLGVDKLVKDSSSYGQRSLRVKGMLVKGSLARRDQPCEYRFKLEEKGAVLNVQHPSCVVPDTFKDMPGMDVMVTAEGTLAQNGDFEATQIFAKCPSKYEMKDRASRGEQAPHSGMSAASFAN